MSRSCSGAHRQDEPCPHLLCRDCWRDGFVSELVVTPRYSICHLCGDVREAVVAVRACDVCQEAAAIYGIRGRLWCIGCLVTWQPPEWRRI